MKSLEIVRNWEVWEGPQRFLLDGRLMLTAKPKLTLATFLALNIPSIYFFFSICGVSPFSNLNYQKFLSNGDVNIFLLSISLYIATNTYFFMTVFFDPGLIPRSRSLDRPSYSQTLCLSSPHPSTPALTEMKYCSTCNIIRPPRSMHCQICNACILGLDHHCTFLGTCIGRGNYFSFFLFCNLSTAYTFFVFAGTCGYINEVIDQNRGYDSISLSNILSVIAKSPFIYILFFYSFLGFLFLSLLCGYHWWIVLRNSATHEEVRKQFYWYVSKPGALKDWKQNFRVSLKKNYKPVFDKRAIYD